MVFVPGRETCCIFDLPSLSGAESVDALQPPEVMAARQKAKEEARAKRAQREAKPPALLPTTSDDLHKVAIQTREKFEKAKPGADGATFRDATFSPSWSRRPLRAVLWCTSTKLLRQSYLLSPSYST